MGQMSSLTPQKDSELMISYKFLNFQTSKININLDRDIFMSVCRGFDLKREVYKQIRTKSNIKKSAAYDFLQIGCTFQTFSLRTNNMGHIGNLTSCCHGLTSKEWSDTTKISAAYNFQKVKKVYIANLGIQLGWKCCHLRWWTCLNQNVLYPLSIYMNSKHKFRAPFSVVNILNNAWWELSFKFC